MRKGFALAGLAVVGIVATTLFLFNPLPSSVTLNTDSSAFINWMSRHGKQYETKEEFELRRQLFEERLAMIQAHNAQNDATWFMKLNQFSDLSDLEI